jgi:hypothetical protein
LTRITFEIAESTVSKYMIRRRGPPSQTWRTFLRNHADAIAAIDLCVVPTLTFECLFAFLVLGHGRRQLLWFAVTRHPTAEWLAQQIVEAFPWGTAPTYLVRDNDGAYGRAFTNRVGTMGIRDHPISPRSPWQNPHHHSPTLAMQPAGRDPEARLAPGTGTLPLCWRGNASAFWIMLLLVSVRTDHGIIVPDQRNHNP